MLKNTQARFIGQGLEGGNNTPHTFRWFSNFLFLGHRVTPAGWLFRCLYICRNWYYVSHFQSTRYWKKLQIESFLKVSKANTGVNATITIDNR
jgi:hypothetical protein